MSDKIPEKVAVSEKSPGQFYTDYLRFIGSRPDLLVKIKTQVDDWYTLVKRFSFVSRPPTKIQKRQLEEGLGLFCYGVELAKKLQPKLTEDVPEPSYIGFKMEPVSEGIHSYLAEYDPYTKEILLSAHQLGVQAGEDFARKSFKAVDSREFGQKSVLSALLMGKIVIAAAEEYAHHVLIYKKQNKPHELKKLFRELKDAYRLQELNDEQYFHQTPRIEFSAVIWKTALMNKFLPWMKNYEEMDIHLLGNVRPYRREFLKGLKESK